MAYKALYRTYRPQTFEEVVGQTQIVKTLQNSLNNGKIAHAYLFAGPRGTGKTTMAKLFAKALNCEDGIGHQCCKCQNCVAIAEGTHPDVIEIDAASNNGVEEVRDLIDKVRYATILGKYKIYIIDEVHMMTPAAFNALLKTLEEPPANVIFILATTEPHKILPTILSRCQRFDFSKIKDDEIKERLKVVLEAEKVSYDEEAVNLIISLADGGMRDALSILEQVLAYSNDKLVCDDILKIFSLESVEEKVNLLKAIFKSEIADILKRHKSYIERGTDIRRLTDDLLLILKDLLVFKKVGTASLFEVLNESQAEELSSICKINQILDAIDLLTKASQDYKFVSSIGPLFEITLLKMANITPEIEEVKKVIIEEKKEIVKEPVIEKKEEPIKPRIEVIEEKKEEVKPTPVFEIEDKKIDDKLLLPKDLKEEEGQNVLSDDVILKIMILSKKELKTKLGSEWNKLNALSSHPIYGNKATLLLDAHLLVASNHALIVSYDLGKQVKRINEAEVQKELQAITQLVFQKKMFVYALDRNTTVESQNKFLNLKQIGKLPKPESITLEWIGE